MRRKWSGAAATGALTVVLLAACSGSGGTTAAPEPTTTGSEVASPDAQPSDEAQPAAELEAGPLTVGIWGGVWEKALNAVLPGFTEEYGVEVVLDISNSADRVSKLQASEGSAMDVAFLTPEAMVNAEKSGVLAVMTEDSVPNLANIYPDLLANFEKDDGAYAAPISWTSTGILYRPDLIGKEFTDFKDLWDPALQGKVAIQNMPTLGAAEFMMQAANAFGSGPEDIEAGFAALKELRPNIQQFYSVSSDALAALVAGDLWAVETIANQGIALESEGVKVFMPENGVGYSIQAAAVTSGTAKPNLAQAFLDYLLRPDVQAIWSEQGQTGPSCEGVELPPAAQANISETPDKVTGLLDVDFEFVATNLQAWTERWQREVAN